MSFNARTVAGTENTLSYVLVTADGGVDGRSLKQFQKVLDEGSALLGGERKPGRMVVDFSGCNYIFSGGLSALLREVRRHKRNGVTGVVMAGVCRDLEDRFELVGLAPEIFKVFATVADAEGQSPMLARRGKGKA